MTPSRGSAGKMGLQEQKNPMTPKRECAGKRYKETHQIYGLYRPQLQRFLQVRVDKWPTLSMAMDVENFE